MKDAHRSLKTLAGLPSFLTAAGGFAAGLLLFALTGYSFFSFAPPPIASAFSAAAPFSAFLAAFAYEAFFIGGMALVTLLFPMRFAYLFLFLRGMALSFSSAYLYGTHPSPLLYLAYVLPSAAIFIAEAALCELCTANASQARKAKIGRCAPAFLYYTGVVLCFSAVLHLLLALAGR